MSEALLLTLRGPLQSWGSDSRFAQRTTESAPTKSGVFGLLAAAKGLRRTDPLTDLLGLSFGVRVDAPGRLQRDFQTARTLDGKQSMPLSFRYYLSDAVFVAAIGSDDRELLDGLRDAISSPVFPLYLGRRSCPPAGPIHARVVHGTVREALAAAPWEASESHCKAERAPFVRLRVIADAERDETNTELIRDHPVSYDPHRREYAWRATSELFVDVQNDHYRAPADSAVPDHHPLSLLT